MTGPNGNSEFSFPKTLEAKPRGIMRVQGKQKLLFPVGLDITCLVIPHN